MPIPEKNDVILILGGPMGLKDIGNPLYPWLKEEINLIKYSLKNKVGVIGVCLGAQLLAHAVGGSVKALQEGKQKKNLPEIGWGKIFSLKQNKNEIILSYFKSPLDVLHWHEDRIVLPNESILLASSNRCKEQFFHINNMAYGIQCHIEIEESMIKQWIYEDQEFIYKGLGKEGIDIISSQQKQFANKSEENRLLLIRGILTLLTANKTN